jgi:hypothetical protein
MGYLEPDATGEVKQDNMLQRLFWPSDHAGEADQLGKQGLWACLVVALVSFVVLSLQGQWIPGLVVLCFYGLGGIGVREHSQIAAVLVAVTFCITAAAGMLVGHSPSLIGIVAAGLLIANVRGTRIANKWARAGGPEARPQRQSGNIWQGLSDQMPATVWPRMKILFFILAGFYLLITMLSTVLLLMGAPRRVHPRPPSNTKTYGVPAKP